MRQFGLIGYPLSHSFSQQFFTKKFHKEEITDAEYKLYPLQTIQDFLALIEEHPDLLGLNVTTPYKEQILPFLAEIDPASKGIGAVNVLKKLASGGWKGYNSDYYGFASTLLSLGKREYWMGKSALVFGSGGSAKAVKRVLESLDISFVTVSRSDQNQFLSYQSLQADHIRSSDILINCTPVGMYPNIENRLPIPYDAITDSHLVIDLIYNPERTRFLEEAEARGAHIVNGFYMLRTQAEKAWEIWNTEE